MKALLTLSLLFLSSLFIGQNEFNKYMNEANFCMQKEDYINAIKKYSKALEYKSSASNHYKVADVYMYRAICRFSLQNTESALSDLDEALKIKPEYTNLYQLKSQIYFHNKQFDKCIEWCDKGLEIKPGADDMLMRKAGALTSLKRYNESNAIYFKLLEENNRNQKACKMIANNYQMKKNWDSAQVYFSMAIQIDPLDFESFFDRGICKAEKKDFAGALSDNEQAMRIDSLEKFIGYNNIAYFIKLAEKDYKGAIEYFNKAIELNPKFAYSYSNRGYSKLKLGDIKGAYQDIRKSIELDNTNSYAYKNLALVCLEDGKKSDACKYLLKAKAMGYEERYDDEVEKLLQEHCKN
ncbi:MAG: tetratricopeptide repeat protein [Bacteroidetes bacterium]|nr:tetratricopeptide repeat protein [Bacteroidota bacterium]